MAAGSRGGGDGTSTKHGIVETLNAPFAKAAGAGRTSYGGSANHAPFDQPQDTGNGGIPTVFFSPVSEKTAAEQPASGQQKNSSLGTIAAGTDRKGTR